MQALKHFTLEGQIVDVVNQRIISGVIEVEDGRIKRIKERAVNESHYILPGFVDAHVHIESSMLVPSEFARVAVTHGTIAVVSDPHEIANVLGVEGVKFMIENGKKVPFKFYFGAPSCVPATKYETSGASLGPSDVEKLLALPDVNFLTEMMNYPGVISKDSQVMKKLEIAKKAGKPIDGHAPGLSGDDLQQYINSGISTDHEASTFEEAFEKIQRGMMIIIREGSAARNFDTLSSLIQEYPAMVMMGADDLHPSDLLQGHVNVLVKRALALGYDVFRVIRAATYNPVKHYNLKVGLLQPGDPADMMVVNNLSDFKIKEVFIDGIKVSESGSCLVPPVPIQKPNRFRSGLVRPSDFVVKAEGRHMRVIKAYDGQLSTTAISVHPNVIGGEVVVDLENDILKIAVINRYQNDAPPFTAFVQGFGLKRGAMASTVAHDSHNIIVVGTNDEDMARAVNAVIEVKGGISVADKSDVFILPLPVAGLMSDMDGQTTARRFQLMEQFILSWGSNLKAPFMTLSFMALLVIPELKISDKSLFDGTNFAYVPLFIEM